MIVRFSASALRDLEHGLGVLDDRRAAGRIAETIERRLRTLKRTPRALRVVPEFALDEMREIIVPPFRMVYRIRRAEIRLVAVVHVRRDFGRVVSRRRG